MTDVTQEIQRINGLIAEAHRALADDVPIDLSPLTGLVRALCDEILVRPLAERSAAQAGIESVVAALDALAKSLDDWKAGQARKAAGTAQAARAYARRDKDDASR
jgi:hypothetical protein